MKEKLNDIESKRDDSKDIVVIDYYDRIRRQWIKLEVTKEVARLLHAENEKFRKKQNQYNKFNKSYDQVFNDNKFNNEKFIINENSNIDMLIQEAEEKRLKNISDEHYRTLIENSLCCLSPEQREVVIMAYYNNMSYREIGIALGIDKSSVYARMKNAEKNIKKHIKNSQN